MLINLVIPLIVGGILIFRILYVDNNYLIVAPAWLIFYGLALINASKYTVYEIR